MTAWDVRMLAYDKRDAAIQERLIARSYLREGSRGMHRHTMRKALKSWAKFRQYMKEARNIS